MFFGLKNKNLILKNNSPTYPKALFENYFLIQKYIDKLLKFFFFWRIYSKNIC